MSFFFVMSTTYYRIRQQCKLVQLESLSQKLNQKLAKIAVKQPNSAFLLQFRKLNQEVLNLFREIPAQNLFWSPYLTLYFIVYIFAIVYLTYCFFFVKTSLDGLKKSFFLLFANNFMTILIIITLECTRVVRNNMQLHRQCMQVAKQLLELVPFTLTEQLKIDQLIANYKFVGQIGFRLLNNYQVDAHMFQMVKFLTNNILILKY